MSQLNFHIYESRKTPPAGALPIIQKCISAYKLWDEFRNHIPKKSRYTLGGKIDNSFLDTLELLYTASYLSKEEKFPFLRKAVVKFDILKFFLQILWEIKALDNKKYILLSEPLNEIGKMLGGWIKGIKSSPLKENSRP